MRALYVSLTDSVVQRRYAAADSWRRRNSPPALGGQSLQSPHHRARAGDVTMIAVYYWMEKQIRGRKTCLGYKCRTYRRVMRAPRSISPITGPITGCFAGSRLDSEFHHYLTRDIATCFLQLLFQAILQMGQAPDP
jgi:hypothetical protein